MRSLPKLLITVCNIVWLAVFFLGTNSWSAVAFCSIEPKASYEILLPDSFAKTIAFTLVNNEKDPREFHVAVEYWHPHSGLPALGDWLQVSPEVLILKPDAGQDIHLQIRQAPANNQEVLVMLYVSSIKSLNDIKLNLREGIPCYFFCGQERNSSLQINSLDISKNSFVLTLTNTGSVHAMPFGNILVKKKGRILADLSFKFDQPIFSGEKKSRDIVRLPEQEAGDEAEVIALYHDPYTQTGKLNSCTGIFQLERKKQ